MISAPPGPMVPSPSRVVDVSRETPDTVTLRLEAPEGFRFAPGQFNMLYVFGVGEVAISISGDPARPAELIHTVREVGAVTRAICSLERSGVVGVRGPYGHGWPLERARGGDLLLVAGGMGLVPIRPAIHHVLRHRTEYRDVALLLGGRTPGDLLFRGEIDAWRRDGRIEVLVTVDGATPDWKGPVGVVPALIREARFEPARTLAFVCGPEVMMRFTERELARHGIAHDRMYLSLERNMRCAIGFCGHCQLGPAFICKDGPVLRYDRLLPFFPVREA